MRTLMIVALFATLTGSAAAQGTSTAPSPSPSASASDASNPGSGAPAPAGTITPDLGKATIQTMLKSGHADSATFGSFFLSKVTIDQVNALLSQLSSGLGDFTSIDGDKGDYVAHFTKGSDEVLIHFDDAMKINGLFFKPPKLQASSLDDALSKLRALKGTLSYVLLEGGSQRAALNASEPLAVGSAFKLAVLSALRDEITKGRRKWTDTIPLDGSKKSLPSGILQTWPDGMPISLATYAADMISISDNTAADTLIRADGPAALAPYARENVPFLTTRELFILKSKSEGSLRDAYLAARTPTQRANILQKIDAMILPGTDDDATTPTLAVEWHYSVTQLCGLMANVATLPLMSINPGAADPKDFRRVAFKGGSDTGVINLTTQVTTKRGTMICFSATVNDSERDVDESGVTAAYGAVLSALAGD